MNIGLYVYKHEPSVHMYSRGAKKAWLRFICWGFGLLMGFIDQIYRIVYALCCSAQDSYLWKKKCSGCKPELKIDSNKQHYQNRVLNQHHPLHATSLARRVYGFRQEILLAYKRRTKAGSKSNEAIFFSDNDLLLCASGWIGGVRSKSHMFEPE